MCTPRCYNMNICFDTGVQKTTVHILHLSFKTDHTLVLIFMQGISFSITLSLTI